MAKSGLWSKNLCLCVYIIYLFLVAGANMSLCSNKGLVLVFCEEKTLNYRHDIKTVFCGKILSIKY